jgi:hypothetical protein
MTLGVDLLRVVVCYERQNIAKNVLPEKTPISKPRNYASSETMLGSGGPFGAVNLALFDSTDTGCFILDTEWS